MAGNSYGKEAQKIYNTTDSDGWIHFPNKTSIKVIDEAFVNEYEVEDKDGEIKERGFFFTKKELDGIVKRHR
jgi:hypothetical protein